MKHRYVLLLLLTLLSCTSKPKAIQPLFLYKLMPTSLTFPGRPVQVYIGKYFGDIVAVKKQTRQGKEIEKYLLRELTVLK